MSRTLFILCAVIAIAYASAANYRLLRPSQNTHFLYLAEAFLAGQGELLRTPPHGNDWASYQTLTLQKQSQKEYGTQVKAIRIPKVKNLWRTLQGQKLVIPPQDIKKRHTHYFVSFPPLPALLMLPLFSLFSFQTLDVLFTMLFAIFNVGLCYWVLDRFRQQGYHQRSTHDLLWLSCFFGLGTAHAWCAVLGQVWYTALIIGVTFHWLFLYYAFDMRRPYLAGLALALAFSTRASLVLLALFFYAQVLYPLSSQWSRQERIIRCLKFSVIPLLVGLSLLMYNEMRFESYSEFGHSYLAGGQLQRIQKYGLFHYIFVPKNLIAAFLLLPMISFSFPYLKVSWHGMAIQASSPAFLWLIFALYHTKKTHQAPIHKASYLLAIQALILLTLLLFYQNTGWIQYSWRFILDLLPLLLCILALSHIKLNRWFKVFVVISIVMNMTGAIGFQKSIFRDTMVNLPILQPH